MQTTTQQFAPIEIPVRDSLMSHSVAAVIPAYNVAAFICDTLDSVARQERLPEQIVVVDDGSTDDTAQRVRDWSRDRGIAVELLVQENRGPGAARNAGILRAEADLIAFLDADDVWLPNHLITLGRGFDAVPQLVLSFADQQESDESGLANQTFLRGKAIERLPYKRLSGGLRLLEEPAYVSLIGGNYVPTSGSVVRKQAAEHIGLFDVSLLTCEDRDFLLRLSRVGEVGYFPVVVAHKRVHDANISHPRHKLSLQKNALEVLLKMNRMADQLKLSAVERQATRRTLRDQARGFLYTASCQGSRDYLESCTHLARRGIIRPALNPKHLLRSLLHENIGRPD